jgi:hypothetical protein
MVHYERTVRILGFRRPACAARMCSLVVIGAGGPMAAAAAALESRNARPIVSAASNALRAVWPGRCCWKRHRHAL